MAGQRRKPVHQTRGYLRKQAGILKQKRRHERTLRKRAFLNQAKKQAVEAVAEEAFGEGGLTPARQEALSAVVLGPDGGELSITSVNALRKFIKEARAKFTKRAGQYLDIHLNSTAAALSAGEFDVAARHAEWAIEALGDKEERVVERAPKAAPMAPPSQPIVVGVNLGGVKAEVES